MKIIKYKENVKQNILNILENEISVVFIYSNSCFHCHKMKPEWRKVMQHYKKSSIKGSIIELEANDILSLDYNKLNKYIVGYPSIFIFKNGKKIKEFNSNRRFDNIVKFINSKFKKKTIKNKKQSNKTKKL